MYAGAALGSWGLLGGGFVAAGGVRAAGGGVHAAGGGERAAGGSVRDEGEVLGMSDRSTIELERGTDLCRVWMLGWVLLGAGEPLEMEDSPESELDRGTTDFCGGWVLVRPMDGTDRVLLLSGRVFERGVCSEIGPGYPGSLSLSLSRALLVLERVLERGRDTIRCSPLAEILKRQRFLQLM